MAQWNEITTVEEWNSALAGSKDKPFVILKHSTACPVSFNALQEYEGYLNGEPKEEIDYLLVKVIESRPVSNQIAADTGVQHASPQILYIKNREPYWNTSHWSITVPHMKAVID